MGRRKVVYEITYPNGMIYIGMDLTDSVSYFGSPSNKERIRADLGDAADDFTARKRVLWASATASDSEIRSMERRLIVEHRANDPSIGYNLHPPFKSA